MKHVLIWVMLASRFAAHRCEAAIETFTASGAGVSASVTFQDIGGGELMVTLANTYTGDTPDQAHVLTGLFFSGANGLGEVSATAGPGSFQWLNSTRSTPSGPAVLGTEWAYGSGSSAPGGASAGIVSAGYYTPGRGNFASPGDMLDGSAYGLVSAGYSGSALDGLAGRTYIQGEMVFILNGFSGPLSISNVGFQYGTMLTDAFLTGNLAIIPESGSWAVAAALLGLASLLARPIARNAGNC
jgi:hypothetical protein